MSPKYHEISAQDDGLLTRDQAAHYVNFSTRKLRYEVKAGRIPFVQLGRNVRFIRGDLDAYIEAHRIG